MPIESKLENYYLEVPQSYRKALLSVAPKDLANIQYQSPEIYYNGDILEAIIPKKSKKEKNSCVLALPMPTTVAPRSGFLIFPINTLI